MKGQFFLIGEKKDTNNDFHATVFHPLMLQSSFWEVKGKETQVWVRNDHKEWMDEGSEDKHRDKLNVLEGIIKLEKVGRKKQNNKKKQTRINKQTKTNQSMIVGERLQLLNLQIWGLSLLFIVCSPRTLFICLVIITRSSLRFTNEKDH